MAAETRQEIENQSARERLWDALDYSYGKQIDQSNASYDRAISESNRALVQRGMQRSSYGRQVAGNLANQKVLAANDLGKAKIADYGNRLYQIERDEIADRQWQMQFDENRRQFEEQMAWNRENAATQAAQWERSFNSSNDQWQWEADFKQAQADAAAAKSGGGGGGSRSSGRSNPATATPSVTDDDLIKMYGITKARGSVINSAKNAANVLNNLFR